MGGPIDGIQMHRGMQCGQLRAMLDVQSDSLVTQLLHEICLPVPLQTRGIKAVEHALQHGKRHGNEKFEGRTTEAPQWPQNRTRLFQSSVIAPDHSTHLLKM